jgi:CubicO group peptidase (beta-lactamase class C family)
MPAGVWVDDDRLEQAFRRVGEVVAGGEPPAAALAVARGPRARRADLRRAGHPSVDDASRFPLASISKPIVATAVLQLVDDGLLRLGEPLALHLPELAAADPDKADITAWHVLTHTSGLTEVDWPTALAARADAPLGFEEACRRPLAFAPGTAYLYSSLSFYLLGEVVARLGGPSLEGYLERRVFAPLGRDVRDARPAWRPGARRADRRDHRGRRRVGGRGHRLLHPTGPPGGGFWGTAADVLRFGQGLLRVARTGRAGSSAPAALELMTRDHTGRMPFLVHADGLQVHRALGWGRPRAAACGSCRGRLASSSTTA